MLHFCIQILGYLECHSHINSNYQTFSGSHSKFRKSVLDGSRKESSHSRDEGCTFNSSRHLNDMFLNEMDEKESGGFLECNPYGATSLLYLERVMVNKGQPMLCTQSYHFYRDAS